MYETRKKQSKLQLQVFLQKKRYKTASYI
jgi:hypothetical protein